MGKQQMSTQMMVFGAFAVVMNLLGGYFMEIVKIPLLFLDAVGTVFAAAAFGPGIGALVGVVTNLVLGVTVGANYIPFAIVNLVIGLIVGFMSRKWKFGLPTAIVTGIILGVVAPLIGTPIVVAVYGGLTGSGTDLIVLWLTQTGHKIFAATFLSRVWANLVDKTVSCLLVYFILKALPAQMVARFGKTNAA